MLDNDEIIAGGYSYSKASADKESMQFGGLDIWVVKLSVGGNVLWENSYGSDTNDKLCSLVSVSDGNILVNGFSTINNYNNEHFTMARTILLNEAGIQLADENIMVKNNKHSRLIGLYYTPNRGFIYLALTENYYIRHLSFYTYILLVMSKEKGKKNRVEKFLNIVERVGNALPHPATLFAIFAGLILVISWITSLFDISVEHPGTGEIIRPVNLLTESGLHLILTEMVNNFTGFAPLGVVLVAMLGIGIAEGTGFIGAALKTLVLSSPRKLLTFVIVFSGILSNTASEVGYVLLVPLAAVIFMAVGRHPIAGMAAAFAGVSGGYSANLLLGTIDPLLAGLSQEAAQIIDPAYMVNPACNYYFMAASTFFIAYAGTWVTEKIVVPRLGEYKGEAQVEQVNTISKDEKRGLKFAFVTFLAIAGILIWGTVPADGFLRDPETGSLLHSPFMGGIVALIFLIGALLGISYGIGAKTIKSDSDVMNGMGKAMETLGIYIVLVFFAAQFVAYFKWTNLGLIFAIEGARVLQASGLGQIPLLLGFIFLTAIINMVMGSASAKWTVMAPVFIPMFMLLGYSPELTQVVYRIGDSVTNIISPMMSYFALIVAFMQRYEKKAGIGTVIATMLPYSLAFLLIWSVILVIWLLLGVPIGPDAPVFIENPVEN